MAVALPPLAVGAVAVTAGKEEAVLPPWAMVVEEGAMARKPLH